MVMVNKLQVVMSRFSRYYVFSFSKKMLGATFDAGTGIPRTVNQVQKML